MNFWLCIWFGEPIFGYLYFKRYFLPILQIHFGVLLDTEPVSGSGSPIHNLWFGPSLPSIVTHQIIFLCMLHDFFDFSPYYGIEVEL